MAEPERAAGGHVAAFLSERRLDIMDRFAERVKTVVPSIQSGEAQLMDELPELLEELARAVRRGEAHTDVQRGLAEGHGRQRLHLGYDLSTLVREYGLLRDCILLLLEQEAVPTSLREIRLLSEGLSLATADSVRRYMAERQSRFDDERRYLLGMFEQAPGFLCFLRGPELVFELANAAYLDLVGGRDVIGKRVRDALPELEGQGYFELLGQVFSSGEAFVGHAMKLSLRRAPDGALTEALLDFMYQPIVGADGRVAGVLVQGQEVTEIERREEQRRAVEAALRASEVRYRTLFESIDHGFCLMQLLFDAQDRPVDYRFLEANAAFEGQTGLAGAVGKTARELVPDLDASWFELYGKVALTGETVRFENHAPAMERWFDVYASRVGDPALRQVALVFKDVTERKLAEQERERLLALESRARREAEQASRLKDEFLATLSHELRTPLTSMLGWLHVLRTGSLAPEKRERALATVERNARAQAQLIEDLLDVSRILAGKLRLQCESVDLSVVIEGALETMRPAVESKSIALELTLAPPPGSSGFLVKADPGRLQQVVWNLLANALKFTSRNGRIDVRVERQDDSVVVAVADSGRGIRKDFLPFVFERFRQAEGGPTRAHGGLGLGLSIVRQVVELHGGTVSVESEGEGRGARFTVKLPALERASAPPPWPGEQTRRTAMVRDSGPLPQLTGLHVLVVDDEEDTRELLRTLLEGGGARVRLAASVAEGLQLLADERPSLMLSDIGMPDEDGFALLSQVRALPPQRGGDVPVIALTAYAREEDRARTLEAGFAEHVRKPVEPRKLLALLAPFARSS